MWPDRKDVKHIFRVQSGAGELIPPPPRQSPQYQPPPSHHHQMAHSHHRIIVYRHYDPLQVGEAVAAPQPETPRPPAAYTRDIPALGQSLVEVVTVAPRG
ncbi:hypothetical protein Tco_0373825 [Tanacetum coccineum]